ncbi:MAG: HXXEE domain-containing protein [Bacteroidetes bacterium]|nr:HXXEE domain-containing protein [Bacteroidota bacterium]
MKHLAIIGPGIFILFLCFFTYALAGKVGPIVIGGASAGGFLLYLKTGYKYRFDTSKVIVAYLLTVIFFIIHVYEEYIFGFEHIASQLSGEEVSQKSLLTIAAFFGPVMWITGAILIIKQWALGYYFLAFFFVAMTVAELTHFIFPFILYGGWRYTAGVTTAALPLIPAWYGLIVTLKETKRIRDEKKSN